MAELIRAIEKALEELEASLPEIEPIPDFELVSEERLERFLKTEN